MSTLEYSKAQGRGPQQIMPYLTSFMVDQCGWTLEDVVADTSTDKWYIFSTVGTIPGRYRKAWFTIRAINSYIDTDTGTYYLGSGTQENNVFANGASNVQANNLLTSHFFGDADGVWWVFHSSSDMNWYYLYVGFFDSVYTDEEEERYPVCTIGHRYDYLWLDSNRCRAYAPWNTFSGTAWDYHVHKDVYSNGTAKAQPGTVDGTNLIMPLIIRNGYEVRGKLKHIKSIGGSGLATKGSWVTVSGSTHKYFVVGNDTTLDEWVCFGPVSTSSGTDWVVGE